MSWSGNFGNKNGMWKGGKFIDHGYVRLSQHGGRFEHRVVMENYLGRKLERWEHVHHVNGNKADNRIENLEVLSKHEHMHKHRKTWDCKIANCKRIHRARGLCVIHYNQWLLKERGKDYQLVPRTT